MQHYQVPIQNQFQTPIVSQQQSFNNVQIPSWKYAQNPQTHLQMQHSYL